ncbi:DNA photolyase phr1 [Didymella glomerata]|uniref:DNA photolyase phr1 n=1 Tax=Didymella glomerata TaxID=749621 RepID=A0A9W9C1B1_9PLEO|nr:DNA photolyase phr1 [Didymella glomerata]
MPPKRKAAIPPNAASVTNYTDSAGDRANKRSRISKPVTNNFKKEVPPEPLTARNGENGGPGEQAEAEVKKDKEPTFDHSRPEERSGVVDRRYYPAKMSNKRCAQYNDNEIPQPIKLLNKAIEETAAARKAIRDKKQGDAIMSPQDWEAHLVSPAKCDFELRSVETLRKELAELDIPLHIEVIKKRRNVPGRLIAMAEE